MPESKTPSDAAAAPDEVVPKADDWARRVLFWLVNTDGNCELIGENWTSFTGQPLADARGSGWLGRVADDDRPALEETLRRALLERRGFTLRYRLRQANGNLRWVLHQASPRLLPSGRFDGLIGTLIDTDYQPVAEADTEDTMQRIFGFLEGIKLAAVSIDFGGCVVHANDALSRLLGADVDPVGADWIGSFVVDADRQRVAALLAGRSAPIDLPADIEYSIMAGGEPHLLRWHLTLIRDFSGKPHILAMMGTDITQWRAIGDQSRLVSQMFENSAEAMMITDSENNIVSVNAAFTRLTGFSSQEVIGRNARLLQSGLHGPEFYAAMWREINSKGHWQGDIWGRHKDGHCYPKFLAITAIRNAESQVSHYSAIFYDASDRRAIVEELDFLAHFDTLTELPNRMLLLDRLEQALAAAGRYNETVALLFIDLDEFKPINDTWGHAVGDEVLKEVAQRMARTIRAVDTAARLGGDEFVVVLPDVGGADNAMHVAGKLSAALAEPHTLSNGARVTVGASIGIRLSERGDIDPAEMLRTADDAMYLAKREGGARIAVYRSADAAAPGAVGAAKPGPIAATGIGRANR